MLPLQPPLAPMLARAVAEIPLGMWYEPKWDGWRCLLFRDKESVRLYSRRGTELTVFFPDLVAAALAVLPDQVVLDGEIAIISDGRLVYTKLAERHSHPERAGRLAQTRPATFLAFDLLAVGSQNLLDQPQRRRRELLVAALAESAWPFVLTPGTNDHQVAQHWFTEFEASGLDGVIAKPPGGKYAPGQRTVFKIKHHRTADVVVGGYRLDRNSTPTRGNLGSLQLALYDSAGTLHFVGVCAGFPASQRAELASLLTALTPAAGGPAALAHPWAAATIAKSGARVPDGLHRGGGRAEEVVHLIDPLLVCEVSYDHLYDEIRFRSNTNFSRWRPDRDPASCTFAQLAGNELRLTDLV